MGKELQGAVNRYHMVETTFYIEKQTNTLADELLAAGLFRLLTVLYPDADLRQTDMGGHYTVTSAQPLILDQAAQRLLYLMPVIQTAKNAAKLPADLPNTAAAKIDYDTEKQQRSDYMAAFKDLPSEAKKAFAQGSDHSAFDQMPAAPHRQWDVFRMINPASLPSYNSVLLQWHAVQAELPSVLSLIFEQFGSFPNPTESVRMKWKALAKDNNWKLVDASSSQFLNPSQGKGINRPKSDGSTLTNMKSFWLLEYLKWLGLYEVGLSRQLRGSKDRKTYVIAVGEMGSDMQTAVTERFRRLMPYSETAIKSDIRVVNRYLKAFLDYQETLVKARNEEDPFDDDPRPADYVKGFQTSFYKDMGNAVVTMNLAFLNLPSWLQVKSLEDHEAWNAILEEHDKLVRTFEENRGEDIELLQRYRDFIVADDIAPFFDFTNRYAAWYMSKREQGKYAIQLQETNLRRLIMSTKPQYSAILQNDGFRNVAYAIRQSTVNAQYAKKQGDRRYDVRYGLGQELTRQSQYENEFLAALADFLHKYNAENSQVMANRSGPYRKSIRMDDIEAITALVDEFGSDLICKLLVAFGYARAERTETQEK